MTRGVKLAAIAAGVLALAGDATHPRGCLGSFPTPGPVGGLIPPRRIFTLTHFFLWVRTREPSPRQAHPQGCEPHTTGGSMTVSDFAKLKKVSRRAVQKAIAAGNVIKNPTTGEIDPEHPTNRLYRALESRGGRVETIDAATARKWSTNPTPTAEWSGALAADLTADGFRIADNALQTGSPAALFAFGIVDEVLFAIGDHVPQAVADAAAGVLQRITTDGAPTVPWLDGHTDGEAVGPEHSAESGAHDEDAAPEAEPGTENTPEGGEIL